MSLLSLSPTLLYLFIYTVFIRLISLSGASLKRSACQEILLASMHRLFLVTQLGVLVLMKYEPYKKLREAFGRTFFFDFLECLSKERIRHDLACDNFRALDLCVCTFATRSLELDEMAKEGIY